MVGEISAIFSRRRHALMKLINLTCNHCGAPLEVAEGTKFVTCRFCSSRLAIEHSESAFYTRVLEALENQTSVLSQDLETIKVQNEIERLDREWQMQREQLCHRSKTGRLVEPSDAASGCLAVTQGVFGLLWFVVWLVGGQLADSSFATFVSLFGLLIGGLAIATFLGGAQKARRYESARSSYESHRSQLVADLGSRKASA
jgi:uncharacterized Zn finger protein (UPF0148 family)